MLDAYLPSLVNSGSWITAWTLNRLRELPVDTEFVLPICSLATPFAECVQPGSFTLPPLYHEALDDSLKERILDQILTCFPHHNDRTNNAHRIRVVELPQLPLPKRLNLKIVAFSVDTAVEEHGPHLPLGTDTIQSYSVLRRLRNDVDGFEMFRPVDYGQLTWGLPFGFSIDLTTTLLSEYVCNFAAAVVNWLKPEALYVVDVHGSITHRQAIVDGLNRSGIARWAFRWLHEPLAEFASERGDQHAGGVETALVELVSRDLIDAAWFPGRIDEIAAGQMSFRRAVALTPDLAAFKDAVIDNKFNGVIGDIHNHASLDAPLMFQRMLDVARRDVDQLLSGELLDSQNAGDKLW
ncbi:MAG: creatininase family protein [Planctomycetota bacterium]|nr:creatininase family protein [Planctomycetota bacterium]